MKKVTATVFVLLCVVLLPLCGKRKKAEQVWYSNLDSALVVADEVDKPLLVEFSASWCPYCKTLEDSTLANREVRKRLENFVLVRIDVDKFPSLADSLHANARKYGGVSIPNILFLKPNGEKIKHIIGFRNPDKFCTELDTLLQISQE